MKAEKNEGNIEKDDKNEKINEEKINALDKIFLIFAPEVDENQKFYCCLLFSCFCCCSY